MQKKGTYLSFFTPILEKNLLSFVRDNIKIFTWTSSIFIALIGLLLITDSNTNFSFNLNNPVLKGVATLALILFTGFSVNWQQRNRLWINQSGQVINKIQELLHCFDKGYFDLESEETLFPVQWRFSASANRKNFFQRLSYANYISATIFLGILTIIMVWIHTPSP